MSKPKKKNAKKRRYGKELRAWHQMIYVQTNQIESQYPDVEKEFWINDFGSLTVGLVAYRATTTYGKNDTWESVKLRMEAIINNTKEVDCFVCMEPIKQRVSCGACVSSWCTKCHAEMYHKNEGQSICPICRYTVGVKTQACNVEKGYQCMLRDFSLL